MPFLTTETQSTAIVPWAQQWTILEDIVPTNPHLRPHCQNRLATLPRRTPVTIQQPTTTVLHHYTGHHVFYTHNIIIINCISRHLQLRTGGFCPCKSFTARMPLLMATNTFGLGRRRWSSPQQCYRHYLCAFMHTNEENKNAFFSV